MLFAFSVAPATVSSEDGSMAQDVARAIQVVKDSGLPYELTSMFTTIEGSWEEVMPVIHQACEAVGQNTSRVSLVIKADLRPGFTGQMTSKVTRVEDALERLANGDHSSQQ